MELYTVSYIYIVLTEYSLAILLPGIAQTVELFSGDQKRYLTNDLNYNYDDPTSVS